LPRRGAYVGAYILAALPLWALVPLPSLTVVIASRVVTGIGAGPVNPILWTIFQERVPPELRGRVFGAITAAVLVAAPGGVLLAGYALEAFGLRPVLAVIAAAYLLVTLSMLVAPALRDMGPRQAPSDRVIARHS
jgi:MFS family permease